MVLARGEMETTPKHHLPATPHKRFGNRHPAIDKLTVCRATAMRIAQESAAKTKSWEAALVMPQTMRTKIRPFGRKEPRCLSRLSFHVALLSPFPRVYSLHSRCVRSTNQRKHVHHIVVVVLPLTRIMKSVVTGRAPVNLELRNTPEKKHKPKVVNVYHG